MNSLISIDRKYIILKSCWVFFRLCAVHLFNQQATEASYSLLSLFKKKMYK